MTETSSSATIGIRITLDENSRYSLSLSGFHDSDGNGLKLHDLGSIADLKDLRSTVDDNLAYFKELLGDRLWLVEDERDEQRWSVLNEAMRFLYTSGQACLGTLLGKWQRKSHVVKEFCNRSLTAWRLADNGAVPLIDVTAPVETLFPVEVLPLFGLGAASPVTDRESLRAACGEFVGFAGVVRRVLLSSDLPNNHVLSRGKDGRAAGRLPIKFFHHATLLGSRDEADFLQESPLVSLDGPWPSEHIDPDAMVDLAIRALYNPLVDFNGLPNDAADQIHHLACHCDMVDKPRDSSALVVANKGWEAPISLQEMRAGFMNNTEEASSRGEKQVRDSDDLPLVFLNACESSTMSSSTSSSFPDLFLTWGSRGVVGTETEIPDEVASEFAKLFYAEMLQCRPVGVALHRARDNLLRTHCNPLGIVYTLYGDPDLHLEGHPAN